MGVLSAHACDLYNARARAGLLRACVRVVQGRARTIQGRARTIQGHARTLFGLYSGLLLLKCCVRAPESRARLPSALLGPLKIWHFEASWPAAVRKFFPFSAPFCLAGAFGPVRQFDVPFAFCLAGAFRLEHLGNLKPFGQQMDLKQCDFEAFFQFGAPFCFAGAFGLKKLFETIWPAAVLRFFQFGAPFCFAGALGLRIPFGQQLGCSSCSLMFPSAFCWPAVGLQPAVWYPLLPCWGLRAGYFRNLRPKA